MGTCGQSPGAHVSQVQALPTQNNKLNPYAQIPRYDFATHL